MAQHAASAGEALAMDLELEAIGADTLLVVEPFTGKGEREGRLVVERERGHDDLGIGGA
jgi:hypothetical protein